MSSLSNIRITPPPPPPVSVRGTRSVDLGQLLGVEGCDAFARSLSALTAKNQGVWSRATVEGREAYRASIRDRLPAGVTDLIATVRVSRGSIEVTQEWTCARESMRAQVSAEVQRLVNATVNEALVNLVAERITERVQAVAVPQQLTSQVSMETILANTVQVHVRQRQGGWS